MKFIDLFSGIGGFRLGMEMAGHECRGHCEIDKFADKSYRAMHDVKEGEWFESDITSINPSKIPKADCWCFGFPCQDISVAGKQKGFDGERSSLFFAVTKLIRDIKEEDRPSYLFIENVKNFFSINDGWDFLQALIELDEIGYDAEWQLLNSKHFGVPQNRERVFIIGHLRGRSTRKVFPIAGSNGKALKQIVGGMQGDRVYDVDGVSCTLAGQAGGQGAKTGLYLVPATIKKEGSMDSIELSDIGKSVANCVKARDYKGIARSSNVVCVAMRGRNPDNPTSRKSGLPTEQTIEPNLNGTTNCLTSVQKDNLILEGGRIRRLTPKECFRLQGFPDEFFEKASSVNSDSQLYKQAGNSVTVNVIYEIARRMGIDAK